VYLYSTLVEYSISIPPYLDEGKLRIRVFLFLNVFVLLGDESRPVCGIPPGASTAPATATTATAGPAPAAITARSTGAATFTAARGHTHGHAFGQGREREG
jgi:hypothetical protein